MTLELLMAEHRVEGPLLVVPSAEPHLVFRAAWFILVGWWLSQITILAAWILNVTLIGLPAGIWLLNRIPQVATLKSSRKSIQIRTDDATGLRVVERADRPQRPFWQRALYFLLLGWWFSLIWLEVAWLLGILIVTLSLSFWVFGATGKVTTLRR